jgi:multisubunit Na+/H+ antiporter MnhB subunit
LIIGGGSVVLTLLVYRFVCGERIASLNLKPGKWYTDVLVGVLLAAAFLGLLVLQQAIQSRWLPGTAGPPPEELMTFFSGVVNDPLLLAVVKQNV